MSWYGFTAYERRLSGVKGLVEADSIEEAKAKIDAGDVYDTTDSFDGEGDDGYDLIEIWECKNGGD